VPCPVRDENSFRHHDENAGILFLLGLAALFAWQVGGFVRRNRPQTYTFDHLPQALLP
jgi:hypothetical protein